jgi:hypothetical protein
MDSTIWARAFVINQDPEHGGLIVGFHTGQLPAMPVGMMYSGYADPLRIHQTPLPQKGTHGLVVFPGGDLRNGRWVGSYYPDQRDAITSDPSDPTVDYYAHWSGFWSYLDASGTLAMQWPDSSYLVVGSGSALPAVYRHIVDQNGDQQRVEYTMANRVQNPPGAPFSVNFAQASGTTFSLDTSGSVTIVGGPQATLKITFRGATLNIDASGNIGLDVPSGKNVNITDGGQAGDGVALLSLLIDWLNSHTHSDVQNGPSNTGTPVSPATVQNLQSQIVKLQQ